jgi:hypothetical protein
VNDQPNIPKPNIPKSRFEPPAITTNPDLIIDGRRVHFVWNAPTIHRAVRTADENGNAQVSAVISGPSIPKGILIHHVNLKTKEPCVAWLPWARDPDDPEQERWTLISLKPLSVVEPFVCTRCGEVGGVREGQWWVGAGGT